MREVRVNSKDPLVAHRKGIVEACEARGAQAQLARAVQHIPSPRKALREALSHLSGVVQLIIIHNLHVKRSPSQDAGQQQLQFYSCIVRGENDEILTLLLFL